MGLGGGGEWVILGDFPWGTKRIIVYILLKGMNNNNGA